MAAEIPRRCELVRLLALACSRRSRRPGSGNSSPMRPGCSRPAGVAPLRHMLDRVESYRSDFMPSQNSHSRCGYSRRVMCRPSAPARLKECLKTLERTITRGVLRELHDSRYRSRIFMEDLTLSTFPDRRHLHRRVRPLFFPLMMAIAALKANRLHASSEHHTVRPTARSATRWAHDLGERRGETVSRIAHGLPRLQI